MKRAPVIVISLDAGDRALLEQWMDQGHLPTFSRLREKGSYGRLQNTATYCDREEELASTEALWPAFITGRHPHITGHWDIVRFNPQKYEISCDVYQSGNDYHQFPPFYALGKDYKVAVFDLPYTNFSDQVNGLQLLGWGGTYPYTPHASQPEELYPEIVQTYGQNPILFNDVGIWWDTNYIKWEIPALQQSIVGRSRICRDLLRRDRWDLFITTFNEPHTAGHDLYHLSDPEHPLYDAWKAQYPDNDPVLETYQHIDRAISEILAELPEEAYIVCFSPHGMGLNFSDLMSQTFLPEVLYRFSFPGQVAIAPGQPGTPPPPVITHPIRNSWHGEIWSKMHEPNPIKKLLRPWMPKNFLKGDQQGWHSPFSLLEKQSPMAWMPLMWCQSLWPQMRAFALPGFADGHIRINLKGRERNGIVTEADYEACCEELSQVLYRLRSARTGQPVVKKVIRTRLSATDNRPQLPDSDLVVLWHEAMTDIVDSPDIGRIGPIPYFRAGSHWERGFIMATGPDIPIGADIVGATTLDLPPTILSLMGAPVPSQLDGRSLFHHVQSPIVR